jgi:hypothetical protein
LFAAGGPLRTNRPWHDAQMFASPTDKDMIVQRSDLVAALLARRNNDVVVQLGHALIDVARVEYQPLADRIVICLDPVQAGTVLEIVAEDGPKVSVRSQRRRGAGRVSSRR